MMRRVAKELGFRTVNELVDTIPKEELDEWLAVAWIDGWGEEYLRMGHVVKELHSILNALFGSMGVHISKSDFKTVEQCMPEQSRPIRRKPRKEPEEQPVDQKDATTAWMERMAALYGRR